jgi:hypothetical protein
VSNRWRRPLAALADEARRRVYAELVLADAPEKALPARARAAALRELTAAGLVVDGRADGDVFGRILAEDPPAVRRGVDRWIVDGRVTGFPAGGDDRGMLLRWIAGGLPAGALDERSVTEAIARVTDDPVTTRRYLVDAGLLERTSSGSDYRVVAPSDAGGTVEPEPR